MLRSGLRDVSLENPGSGLSRIPHPVLQCDRDLSDHEMEVCLPQQDSDSESSSNMSGVVFDQRTSVSQQARDLDWDKSDDQNLMEVSTPLGDLDWESSEKSGLMVD